MDLYNQFPVFEANQVLTSRHLNDVFDYLEQQTRLTRAHLTGIGIVCGLDVVLTTAGGGPAIRVTRGCGVTSEGYLILEQEDLNLVAYRTYKQPAEVTYPVFPDGLALWELFPAGEPNTTALGSPAGFLNDKAVVLLLELKKQGLRNCSPNNCDDKGSEITVTVRPLLIEKSNLDAVITQAQGLGSGLTSADLEAALTARLQLPDLRVQRFDVPNTSPVTSNDVYAAFLQVFRTAKLAKKTGDALTAAYTAFRPLLKDSFATNPFANFPARFGFLDSAPATAAQVRFLQYYVEFFEELLRAYDEFRWKGVRLLCTCCPPDGLFPRHLMLGLVHPENDTHAARYRQPFLPSPASGCCAGETAELQRLFARLAGMVAAFTETPALAKADDKARFDTQTRVTPSVLGRGALGARAIAYFYRQDRTPPLYRVWDSEKTQRNRAHHNLSYRSDEFQPAAPAFVTDALRFDLEPYNFLRVEGHLGKPYQSVLTRLLRLKDEYRLPVDVVALRTGAYDDRQPVDLKKESARFQDLETLYDSLREELLSTLAQGAADMYDAPVAGSALPGGVPKLALLKKHQPFYRYPAASVGAFFENHLTRMQSVPYIELDQTKMSDPAFSGQVLRAYCILFAGVQDLPAANYPHVVSIFYFLKLAEVLPSSLDALAFADFKNKYQDLLALLRFLRSEAAANLPADLKAFAPQEELIDQFDHILYDCKLEAIQAVHDEYVRRVGQLRKKQFLSEFLRQHPGIQHKGGVPLGGTFILVYHGEPVSRLRPLDRAFVNTALFAERFVAAEEPTGKTLAIADLARAAEGTDAKALALTDALTRIGSNEALAEHPDVQFVLASLTGRIPIFEAKRPLRGLDEDASKVINATVSELDAGTVIADFFLPYTVAGDGAEIQFTLPRPAVAFSTTVGCTSSDGIATVTVNVKGGTAPFEVRVDGGGYQALGQTLSLPAGAHTLQIRDADGTETAEQPVNVAGPITLGTPAFECSNQQFTAQFTITGGTPPYTVNGQAAQGNNFTTPAAQSGTTVTVEVVDAAGCKASTSFTHECPKPCDLPCLGLAVRRGYRFWLPEPAPNRPFREFKIESVVFTVESGAGQVIDLSAKVAAQLVAAAPTELGGGLYAKWVARINRIISNEAALNRAGQTWMTLGYESLGPGRLGLLTIEYFECLQFDIQVTASFLIGETSQRIRTLYRPTGNRIQLDRVEASIPAFDGIRIDKCGPNAPSQEICQTLPKFTVKQTAVSPGRGIFNVTLTAVAQSTEELLFLWEAPDSAPPMGTGPTFVVTMTATSGVKSVIVTAFTKAGCSSTITVPVNIG